MQAHVPQIEVLQRATAFVSHGGMNSVNESLSHGVPMLVIPQMGEQMIIGRRVEELGAGLYIEKAEVTADKLREGVRRLLADAALPRAGSSRCANPSRLPAAWSGRRTPYGRSPASEHRLPGLFIAADAQDFAAADQRQLEQIRVALDPSPTVPHRRVCSISVRRRCMPCLRCRGGRPGRNAR